MSRVAITHVAVRGPYGADAPAVEEALATPRARKMMSRSAYLAALALADLVRELGLSPEARATTGYFLGVGGSAGSLDDVGALLEASIIDDELSLHAFGGRGLAACNPLLAFQLMNNFTMCHGAILEGLRGPNAALFSRGAGTVAALAEAAHAVACGDCPLAIAGGADAPTHPVTLAELARDGATGTWADAAALVALAPARSSDDIVLEGAAHASGLDRPVPAAVDDAVARALRVAGRASTSVEVVVSAASGSPAAGAIAAYAARFPGARVIDVCAGGDALAAGPALAVVAAVEALRASPGRALVLALGVDGDPAAVLLSRGAA